MEKPDNQLLSVGIDVGTSTTQLVFSRIFLKNQAALFRVANIEISHKEIIYQSPIYFTPLIDEEIIDFEAIVDILDQEYAKSGLRKSDIDIGAVIITGESARKHNSKEVIDLLSAYAGDFVVASAGADLESVIAAKGAGADLYSKEHHQSVMHIDIGGGTSNYALFNQGDIIETGCFDIGGRLIKLDQGGKVYHLTPKAEKIIARHQLEIALGKVPTLSALEKFCGILVKVIAMSLGLEPSDDDFDLLITHRAIKTQHRIDSISFSGGVAEFIYYDDASIDPLTYHDIGILLGRMIKNSAITQHFRLNKVHQTLHATVVGAGMHTTSLSGSTVFVRADNLPLKNIPIIKLSASETANLSEIASIIAKRIAWYDSDHDLLAIAFEGKSLYSFEEMVQLAQQIVEGMKFYLEKHQTIIVLLEKDYAKALGFSLQAILPESISIISLDSIVVQQGDYIDIGKPLIASQVLPVIVKTILFQ